MRESFLRLALVVALASCICLGGCRTLEADAGGVGERNQYVSGLLASTIESIDREIALGNEQIRECLERSREIEGGAERIKYLVERYFEVVGRIQDANDRTLAELRRLEEGMHRAERGAAVPDSSVGNGAVSGTD